MRYANEKYQKMIEGNVNEFFLLHPEYRKYESDEYLVLPGFCDMHVHFREPGFSYKETILSGSKAAARGGYTTCCTMPNLNPVADSYANLELELDAIRQNAVIDIIPYASITKGEKGETLSDMDDVADYVVAFSDDGKGVQSDNMMQLAMVKANELGKTIVAHCEVNELLHGGYIHAGNYAKEHNHLGIVSESEWKQVERDINLSNLTGCAYHVCHISTKETVELIRKAKKDGLNVTCEITPHHILLDETDLQEDGRFKMNPPLRTVEDHKALIEGLKDGTIDMIATDHAPHADSEKDRGLKDSPFGIVGLETAFPLLYTELVEKNVITLERLLDLLIDNPRKRFGIDFNGGFSIWKIGDKHSIDENSFVSNSHRSPFNGRSVNIRNLLTVLDNVIVYENK